MPKLSDWKEAQTTDIQFMILTGNYFSQN